MELKEYRLSLDISAKEASSSCGVPLRTYLRSENTSLWWLLAEGCPEGLSFFFGQRCSAYGIVLP